VNESSDARTGRRLGGAAERAHHLLGEGRAQLDEEHVRPRVAHRVAHARREQAPRVVREAMRAPALALEAGLARRLGAEVQHEEVVQEHAVRDLLRLRADLHHAHAAPGALERRPRPRAVGHGAHGPRLDARERRYRE
jgi:hypothetical protein